jgi:urease accessory protein
VFAYSQGLEQAIERGWVKTPADLVAWLQGLLRYNIAQLDVPLFVRAFAAFEAADHEGAARIGRLTLAYRESRELVEEDRHLGRALARILTELGLEEARGFIDSDAACYPCLYALAAVRFDIPRDTAAQALAFGWAENQCLAASRLIPLGQVATQKALSAVVEAIPTAIQAGFELSDDAIGGLAPAQAMVTAWHETQYSRLFRS